MKNLEKIEEMWSIDGKILREDLNTSSINIPVLHSKYHRLLNRARLHLNTLENAAAKLNSIKTDYYSNMLDKTTLEELGWSPNKRLYVKSDIPNVLARDNDVIELNTKIQIAKITVDFLENIIRQINNRNFIIKNIIDYERFTNGMN